MSPDGEVFRSPAPTLSQADQHVEDELEKPAVRDLPLAGRQRARKRKHPEAETGQLQWQVQTMQNTLQELMHAQCPLGLHDVTRPAPEVWDKDPDVLSVAASDSLEGLHDPQSEEDVQSLSDFGDASSQASEPEQMVSSDRTVIARAAARAQLVCQAPLPAASVFDRG
ncbi:hypothetical protein ABVT39_015690 [Epinephelus coioides]